MSSFIPPVPFITPETPGYLVINPIEERISEGESPTAPVGTGQRAVVISPNTSSSDPAVANITDNASEGYVGLAAATERANFAVVGNPNAENAARIQIGLAATSSGNVLSNAGSTVQVADYYKGDILVNYDFAIPVPGVKVNLNVQTVGRSTSTAVDTSGGTIGDNAPAYLTADSANAPDYYINTGSGNDTIKGSAANDFIRAGAGDDIVNGGDGNDIIRAGAGNDEVTFGPGNDVYYLTFDQFLTLESTSSNTRDVLTDFNPSEDSIQLAADLETVTTITGLGTSEVTITYNSSDPASTLLLVSQNGNPINGVQFV